MARIITLDSPEYLAMRPMQRVLEVDTYGVQGADGFIDWARSEEEARRWAAYYLEGTSEPVARLHY